MSKPEATGPKSENPYCMRCSKHLGSAFHETSEHDAARELGDMRIEFDRIVSDQEHQ